MVIHTSSSKQKCEKCFTEKFAGGIFSLFERLAEVGRLWTGVGLGPSLRSRDSSWLVGEVCGRLGSGDMDRAHTLRVLLSNSFLRVLLCGVRHENISFKMFLAAAEELEVSLAVLWVPSVVFFFVSGLISGSACSGMLTIVKPIRIDKKTFTRNCVCSQVDK